MKKKGIQLNQAFGAVLILVLVAILVIVAIYLFGALNTAFPLESVTVVNESGYVNETGYVLDNVTSCRAENPVITSIANTTGAYVIEAANYTLDTDTWTLTNATEWTFDAVKISYTFDYGGSTCEAAETTVSNFSGYPVLIGLVGTIIFLGIVIGVLIGSFAFGGKKGV